MRHEVKGTNTLNGVKKWICPELSTTVISKLPRCGPLTQRPCHSYTWYGVLSSSCLSGRPHDARARTVWKPTCASRVSPTIGTRGVLAGSALRATLGTAFRQRMITRSGAEHQVSGGGISATRMPCASRCFSHSARTRRKPSLRIKVACWSHPLTSHITEAGARRETRTRSWGGSSRTIRLITMNLGW